MTVGHNCVLHGCIIEDDCLIGMGAVIMNGAVIKRGSLIAAGSLVLENTVIPEYSLVTGSPGKVKKTFEKSIVDIIRASSEIYKNRANGYKNKNVFRQIES